MEAAGRHSRRPPFLRSIQAHWHTLDFCTEAPIACPVRFSSCWLFLRIELLCDQLAPLDDFLVDPRSRTNWLDFERFVTISPSRLPCSTRSRERPVAGNSWSTCRRTGRGPDGIGGWRELGGFNPDFRFGRGILRRRTGLWP